eukprot:XP_017953172.1 PREDICTED: nuclear receptor coactivator 5 isoform X2 [Xenopus tropicalis]
MSKAPTRSSPSRRDLYSYGDTRDARRDRSPLRTSPRRENREARDGRDSRSLRDGRDTRDGRDQREARDAQNSRDTRDPRDLRDTRDSRDFREPRDAREYREPRDLRDPRDTRELRDSRSVRDPRDARDIRDPLYDRYRDLRDTRDPLYRRDEHFDRYRPDDLYRKKDDILLDRYRDTLDRPLREPEPDRLKREERRREELYRQYFDEIQRRVDAERPVDCSVVVVNKQSKEYAESVGRKVRDLGMMVDLIFLNTEVSLTQALEDVTRGGSPFAIVITQQHQVHRSCTVNILFGTPQAQLSRPSMGAAPVSSLDNQTSGLANNPALQMTQTISSASPAGQSVNTSQQELQAKILSLFNSGSAVGASSNSPASSTPASGSVSNQSFGNMPNTQQRPGQINTSAMVSSAQRPQPATNQLPASMGPGGPSGPIRGPAPRSGPPPQAQGVYGQHQNRPQGPVNVPNQRPGGSSGINFDNPSVQKALDTLIQSGPSLSHLVSQTAGQAGRGGPLQQSLGNYPRHF